MSRTTKIFLSLILILGLGVPFLFYAPSIIGPMIDRYHDSQFLSRSLNACAPGEMRYVVFYGTTACEAATFNFTTKKLTGGDAAPSIQWSWSGRMEEVYYNICLGYGVTYTDEQIRQIKSILATLPPPARSILDSGSYRAYLNLAFYQNGQLKIYHYLKPQAPPELADLCKTLGIPEHAE